MTQSQLLRQERRAILERRRAERRAEVLVALVAALLVLVAFGIAGALDLQDRSQGLGASMMPDPAWVAGEVG